MASEAPQLDWPRAWRALKGLIADSSRTELAFEVTAALTGKSFDRAFQRFIDHPDGRRLLAERPRLLDTLMNRTTLAALPVGSFGRAYADFMSAGNLAAEGLVDAQEMAAPPTQMALDPDRQYFADRVRDMHDLWHVLTGYGMDEAGEAANLAFNLGQIFSAGIGLMVLAGAVVGPRDLTCSWQRYLWRAWRRGQRATLLTVVPYEELLTLPLEDVRNLLHISAPEVAHPGGILVGNRSDDQREWIVTPVH